MQHNSVHFFLQGHFWTFFRTFLFGQVQKSTFWVHSLFGLFYFFSFCLSSFSFSYLLATVIDLLLGLLQVQEFLRKHHQDGKLFLHWVAISVVGRKLFCSKFFTPISEHYCAYFRLSWPIESVWSEYHWKDLFSRTYGISDANFGQGW